MIFFKTRLKLYIFLLYQNAKPWFHSFTPLCFEAGFRSLQFIYLSMSNLVFCQISPQKLFIRVHPDRQHQIDEPKQSHSDKCRPHHEAQSRKCLHPKEVPTTTCEVIYIIFSAIGIEMKYVIMKLSFWVLYFNLLVCFTTNMFTGESFPIIQLHYKMLNICENFGKVYG